jgi:hypothetical protein
METTSSVWIEDAELGVAVREVGGELQVRAVVESARDLVNAAIKTAYGPCNWPSSASVRHTGGFFAWTIDSAHRLAFARALSPMEDEQDDREADELIREYVMVTG